MNPLVQIILAGLSDIPSITPDEAVELSRAINAKVSTPARATAPAPLGSFLFYLEGLGREVWVQGRDEESARYQLWRTLSDAERCALVQADCIDETPPFIAHTFREPADLGLQQ